MGSFPPLTELCAYICIWFPCDIRWLASKKLSVSTSRWWADSSVFRDVAEVSHPTYKLRIPVEYNINVLIIKRFSSLWYYLLYFYGYFCLIYPLCFCFWELFLPSPTLESPLNHHIQSHNDLPYTEWLTYVWINNGNAVLLRGLSHNYVLWNCDLQCVIL